MILWVGGDGWTILVYASLLGPCDPEDEGRGTLTFWATKRILSFLFYFWAGNRKTGIYGISRCFVFNMGRILLEKEQPNDESELHCRSSARAPLRSAWFLRLLFFFFFCSEETKKKPAVLRNTCERGMKDLAGQPR
jgi:hypothetical protein